MVRDWHVSKAKGNISRAVLYKHRVLLIEDVKLLICQKIEVSHMLGFMHRTNVSLSIAHYIQLALQGKDRCSL